MAKIPVIFTDLDGTLLDHETYSLSRALPALELVRNRRIPLIFCSSKTKAEIEYWRKRLENTHPFISENGGGIFVPSVSFSKKELASVWPRVEKSEGYYAVVLGTRYPILRRALQKIRKEGFQVKGFGDMGVKEIAAVTGLTLDGARLARKRDFDEPFMFHGTETELAGISMAIQKQRLRYTVGGRLHHLMGDNDKGKAVEILTRLYNGKRGSIFTIALGDSPNDLPMLERVDCAILVRNHKGEHDPRISVKDLIKAEGVGPDGWNKAVVQAIRDFA